MFLQVFAQKLHLNMALPTFAIASSFLPEFPPIAYDCQIFPMYFISFLHVSPLALPSSTVQPTESSPLTACSSSKSLPSLMGSMDRPLLCSTTVLSTHFLMPLAHCSQITPFMSFLFYSEEVLFIYLLIANIQHASYHSVFLYLIHYSEY